MAVFFPKLEAIAVKRQKYENVELNANIFTITN